MALNLECRSWHLEINASPAFDFRGIDLASQKEIWSGCEEVCFLLSSVPVLKYLRPKLTI